jgi:dTDP-4-amino-4,6-dideoxygalactose transaminase
VYDELLRDLGRVVVPRTADGNGHVHHLYVVRVPRRDEVLRHLAGEGIGAGIHYPLPIHLLPAFRHLGQSAGTHPRAELFANEILSLPLYPGITSEQQARVVSVLARALP